MRVRRRAERVDRFKLSQSASAVTPWKFRVEMKLSITSNLWSTFPSTSVSSFPSFVGWDFLFPSVTPHDVRRLQ